MNPKVNELRDLEEITISKDGVFANTKEGDPKVPLDVLIYPNRHERRKAAAIRRHEIKIGLYEW